MRPVRDILNELVERRLWPIALVLVLALVAVPLLLAKSSSPTVDASAPPAAAAAAAAAAAPDVPGEPVVSLEQGPAPSAPLRGREKNPFRQQHVAAQPATGTATATSSAGAPGGASTPAPTSGGGPGGSGGSGGGSRPQQPQTTYVYATADIRFGRVGQRLRTIADVPRLTPLPSAAKPIVVYLGTRRDHRTAVFLVSTDVHVQGLGQCVPSGKDCESIELRAGEGALLDFRAADGTITHYELDLDSVALHQTTDKALAQRAYARVSRAGAALLRRDARSSATDAGQLRRLPFRYVHSVGVLHIAPWASRARLRSAARGAFASVHDARWAPAP
jgi:hypothetical protein